MRCKVCGKELTDEKGYCHGVEIDDDVFVCATTDCVEFAIAVVETARAVVAFLDLSCQEDPVDVAQVWDMIDIKLREALGE